MLEHIFLYVCEIKITLLLYSAISLSIIFSSHLLPVQSYLCIYELHKALLATHLNAQSEWVFTSSKSPLF